MQSQLNPHQISMQPQNGHVDLKGLSVAPEIKFLIQYGDTIGQYPSRDEALFATLMALADAGYKDDLIARLCLLESHGISDLPREKGIEWLQQELNRACRKARSLTRRVQGEPLSVDDLKLHDMFQPPRQIIEGLLHEGMLLFGGKVKHGKSWLMLDLALSVATGTPVWGHFAVPEPQPVLYLSLEDPEGRIKHRLDAIRPGFETNDNLELLCDFPLLNKGGLEKLQGYVQSGRYRLIVVDVLAKIEPASQRGSEKTYLEIYDMFAPLQKLRPEHPMCLAMITHLRKTTAEDIFDTIHGSVAYQGVQDSLWVLDRLADEKTGVIHTRPNDGPEQNLRVSFVDGHWDFLGYDADIRYSQARLDVIEILKEFGKPMSVSEVNRHLSQPRGSYRATQMVMHRMLQDGQLVRPKRGLYELAPCNEQGTECHDVTNVTRDDMKSFN